MDDSELYLRVRGCLDATIELFGASAARSSVVRLRGVLASLVPATPERSLFNAVSCTSLAALELEYDALARMYQEAGVRAWTVWTDPDEVELAAFLAARGHKLDSQPMAMAAELSAMRLPATGDLDWVETRDTAVVAALNDAAYGLTGGAFGAAFGPLDDPRWRGYTARHDGKPASCLLCWDGDYGDCAIAAVATLPEMRGRGFASRLLAQALREAGERGCVTTSLQSSPKGLPVYTALGYRELGRMKMWELRVA